MKKKNSLIILIIIIGALIIGWIFWILIFTKTITPDEAEDYVRILKSSYNR